MTRRPWFWVLLAITAVVSATFALRFFSRAFPVVSLDITMDRASAFAAARDLALRERLGPSGFRQAASFVLDSEAQTYVELEAGGSEAFARLLESRAYEPYTWRVRHFRQGETNETTIVLTPDGQPYGFVEHVREDAPGAALSAEAARAVAEGRATSTWKVTLEPYRLVEQSRDTRPTGRVDHTFVYERQDASVAQGKYRVRLVVTGDRLTEVRRFIRIPEAFDRRYAEMRSSNRFIGLGSAIATVVLYGVGAVGIGLFFLMRHHWLIWRPAFAWGGAVAALQVAARASETPLLWMDYDTALSLPAFVVQSAAMVLVEAIGTLAMVGISFMAAESLTRRAFPSHPQLWRVWSPAAAASPQILGRTVAGYLLVAVFFAYEVGLYFVATRWLGWWTPSEALYHPDVLASYVPALSALAPSFQAGFWEECLFRAVPLAAAALIGDRVGHRRLLIGLAVVVQAVVFGAGHAPYPAQPAYARVAELIIPSLGFAAIYLRFGLLPSIVLHFGFDLVWFAIPIFVARAPGIWVDRILVVLLGLVPLWLLAFARVRRGRWAAIDPALLNRAWQPASRAASEEVVPIQSATAAVAGVSMTRAVLAAGGVGLVAWGVLTLPRMAAPPLTIDRGAALARASDALASRKVTLGPGWELLTSAATSRSHAHDFVWETAGDGVYRSLLGSYLATPAWRVRAVTFGGDVAARAEEWTVVVTGRGDPVTIRHELPEARAAASVDEAEARRVAIAALAGAYQIMPADLREVSITPSRLPARTDWTVTFADSRVRSLGQGEARLEVSVAGPVVAGTRRYVHVPEQWERDRRGRMVAEMLTTLAGGFLVAGTLIAGAALALLAWARRTLDLRLVLWLFGVQVIAGTCTMVNEWPTVVAAFTTTEPFSSQALSSVAIGGVGTLLVAVVLSLACGGAARLVQQIPVLTPATSGVAIAAGLAITGLQAAANRLLAGPPPWPSVEAAGTFVPALTGALALPPALFGMIGVATLAALGVGRITRRWTCRRWLAGPLVVALPLLAGAPLSPGGWPAWVAGHVLIGLGLLGAYVLVFRHDLRAIPIAVGTVVLCDVIRDAASGAYVGAAIGGALSFLALLYVVWHCTRSIRRN